MPQRRKLETDQSLKEKLHWLLSQIKEIDDKCDRDKGEIRNEITRVKSRLSALNKGTPKKKEPKSTSVSSKTPTKWDIMEKRLQDRKATLKLLKSMGEDTGVIEAEIKDYQDMLHQSQSVEQSASDPDNVSVEPPNLKVFFFDLDETLLTSADPELNVVKKNPELVKLGTINISPIGRVANLTDTITTKNIVKLLKECSNHADIKWFIISKGENKSKVDQLFAKYPGKIYPDNDDLGISMFNHDNKRKSIEGILNKLDKNYNITDTIFVDDKPENTKPVSQISGMRVINVPDESFNVDWLPITLMTKQNCDQCISYLSTARGANKRNPTKNKKKKKKKTKKGRK